MSRNAPGKYYYVELERNPERMGGEDPEGRNRVIKVIAGSVKDALYLAGREGNPLVVRTYREQIKFDRQIVLDLKCQSEW